MRKKIWIIIMIIAAITLIACTDTGMDGDISEQENRDLVEVNMDDKELLNRSEEISDLVVELYGIDDATTIVFNNEAYIAIVLAFDQEYTEDLLNTIIYQVKEKDTLIENVSVTTNHKIFKQIDDVVYNLLQGKSYDSQVKEINKIINKIQKEK